MIHFTKQERLVLIVFLVVLSMGTCLQAAFTKYPKVKDIVNLIEGDKIYSKSDVNRASEEELISIPYIGPYTARNIVEYRRQNGPITDIAQLKSVKGIRKDNFEKFSKFLKISK